MSTRLRNAHSILGSHLQAPVNALVLMLALGTAAAQSADKPQVGTYSLLYSFQNSSSDGCGPSAGLVRDSSGNLYGTTGYGAQYGYGNVFKVTPSGTETVLHSFAGPPSDGAVGLSLTLDAAGNVYGTTPFGGEFNAGTVFKVTAAGTERVLYNFTGASDGAYPAGGVALDSAGLYGTTRDGGTYFYGVVFKVTAGGTESVIHNFEGSTTDGAYPTGNLIRDTLGNLYSTTSAGGPSNFGTVFKVDASGTESLLYSFKGGRLDGAGPLELLQDTSGNLYGLTGGGGANAAGVVFKLTPGGTESVLLNFNGGLGGKYPSGGLARDAAGNLYGATSGGGSGTGGCGVDGCGVLFELTTAGKEIVLHDFTLSSSSDGANPYGGVVRDASGNLYGTLSGGGAYGCGAVSKFTP